MFNNLIDIERLTTDEINQIIALAADFKTGKAKSAVKEKVLCLMFCENSTRTKCSFELAAKKLGMHVLNFEAKTSSFNKGESMKDTLENLYFIGADAVVIRHSTPFIVDEALNAINYPLTLINGGDGNNAHPTQALLDYFTMLEKIKMVEGKKVLIVGDISHSRVAKSNVALLNKFNADIHLCAPIYFKPKNVEKYNITWHSDIKTAIKGADIIMALRVQKERHINEQYQLEDYIENYQINSKLLKLAKDNVLLMHPGPVNRNIEITSELLDSEKGKTILEQAQNGVFVRMAVLNLLLSKKGARCF